ncbi:NAD(P)H-hydrate dehydratase [Porticoccus sp.]|uniref:NAD(P)H-hydrate dehydratase n=1 Tax=Porticoccus sp. TaxID=2024853 RepID=UPI003F69A958
MHQNLPVSLFTTEQVRRLDQAVIRSGIPGIKLMKRAGYAAFQKILSYWPGKPLTVFCGSGNNGGDGYIVAALAAEGRLPVRVVQLNSPGKLHGDARTAFQYARDAGVPMVPFSDCLDLSTGVVVDAMLGTGFSGEVREPFAQAIRLINQSGLPVVALDVPSGLCANTGAANEPAVEANLTVTFIALKQGLFTGRGPALCGELVCSDLRVSEQILATEPHPACRLELDPLRATLLVPRRRDAHKGDFGHVLIIGGDHGFGGAVSMVAEAALRVGAGLVSVATRPEHVAALLGRRPELMVRGVTSGQLLLPLLARATVLVVGPGLGRSPWSEQLLQQALAAQLPMILDADALNILSEGRLAPRHLSSNWIITPHPGEAARLLGITVQDIEADRFAAVRALQKIFQCAVVLKGAGSLVCHDPGLPVGVCSGGNPGMASGGMGDILSGIVGGLVAQQLSPDKALPLAVCLHAEAADRAAADGGERGILATDLLGQLRQLVNP